MGQVKNPIGEPIDFATLRLSSRPNQFLLLPPDFVAASKPHAQSPSFAVTPDRLMQAWLSLIAAEARVTLVACDAVRRQIRLVARSAWLRFPDDLWIQIEASGEQRASAAIYSRARYGGYDFGVNRKRVEAWLERLPGHLEA